VARFYKGGKSVLSFRGKFYTGKVFPRGKRWARDDFIPRGKFFTMQVHLSVGNSNPGPFLRGVWGFYATTPVGYLFTVSSLIHLMLKGMIDDREGRMKDKENERQRKM
jgi:hypothetical protein